MHKWWYATDDAQTVYAAATLLTPRGRKQYFDKRWATIPENKDAMIKKVHEYWKQNYAYNSINTAKPQVFDDDDRSPLNMQLSYISNRLKAFDDPFLNYIHDEPTGNVHVLNWWAEFGPVELRQMAFDILSIPAMSAEVERVFSSAKRALTPDRSCLTVESLERYELLKNWWSGDIVLQLSDGDDSINAMLSQRA